MQQLTLQIPKSIVDSLPADSDATTQDMDQAVGGWERDLNTALEAGDGDEVVSAVVDIIERFEDRWERYDEYVVELRAWGQSPIYAMAWRDLLAAVLHQIHDHENLDERISRERHHRIFDDGIRPGKG